MLVMLVSSLLILIVVGLPVGFALLAASLLAIQTTGTVPIETLPQRLIVGLDSFPLLAIPLFILAGALMNGGGITTRLIRLSEALVGHIRGSLAHVAVVSNMFMSGVSGSGVADAAATGTTLIPEMVKRGYGRGFSSAILGSAATIGPIIPPSIPMVIYGSIAGVSVGKLFLGGAIPGILMGLGLMVITYFIATKRKLETRTRATSSEVGKAFKNAVWALIMPLIIVGGILSGAFTPTESAVIAVLYALVVGLFVYRDLKWKDIPEKLLETLVMTASVGIIISAAAPFGWIMAFEQGPIKVLELFQSISQTPWVIMLLLMLVMLVLGCFLEGTAIIIITTPVVMPLLAQIGVDPVHYGVILAINVMIGSITPPVGVLMYVTNSISKSTIGEFIKEIAPFLAMLILLLYLFTYVPQLVLVLPDLLMK
ncbi:TRAP transporter large permease [Ammoniphilus resinae]|uniref:C4-dicarboxylate transporter DctM subunit n=1 Tax=Ammoniphilus resinae TaxID=861532 RepID=A0ABS4GWB5_9BACL|nr:TRAP transporter large permease [Ammoniphilus resinae]MBP1934563.1 C4-dicarboxylate transporter DctM subunit [Ammoniphilus resinae]